MAAAQELFTVVIPTLNRAGTLPHTLESCIAQRDDHFRILVSDNHSTDQTSEVIADYMKRDSRIACVRPPARFGQTRSWEFALSKVEEGFGMVIGADDALLPDATSRARDLLQAHPEALAVNGFPTAVYYYPEASSESAGMLHVPLAAHTEVRSGKEWLKRTSNAECRALALPVPYNQAWLHASILEEVKRRSGGGLIHSRVPSIYMGVVAAQLMDCYINVAPGFCCVGFSPDSIGLNVQSPEGGRDKERAFFDEHAIQQRDIPYHPSLGNSRSEHIHLADTLLRAIECGFLPSDHPIAWDRLVANAYHDFHLQAWSEDDQRLNESSLRAVAERYDCAWVLDAAKQASAHRDWVSGLPFPLLPPQEPWTLSVDLRPYHARGVQDAALIAWQINRVCAQESDTALSAGSPSNDLVAWAMASGARQSSELSLQLRSSKLESERRAGERDRAKERAARLRAKLDKCRSSPEHEGS